MNNSEKMLKLTQALVEKTVKDKADKDAVLKKFSDKEKVKPLTTIERLERFERLLGIAYHRNRRMIHYKSKPEKL